MKPLAISEKNSTILVLQQEIGRSPESRYQHRLYCVLLVAQGLTCPQAARLLGAAPRSVESWVRRFQLHGVGGLVEVLRPGRPATLSIQQLKLVEEVLRRTPFEAGVQSRGPWDGKTLARFLEQRFGVTLQARQCQRLLRQLCAKKPRLSGCAITSDGN